MISSHVQTSVAAFALCAALQVVAPPPQRPMEPLRDAGQSVTGAYEGWYRNQDGTFTLLVGYMNRNVKQTLDIPIGPNNRIEPGGPDRGQPTYFLPRRQWGVFTITVPKDFGDRKLTWTLVANGATTAIPMSLNPLWNIEPFRHTMGNTPPKLTFETGGPIHQGPPRGLAASYAARTGEPLALTVWATDDGLTSEGQPIGAGRGRPSTPLGPPGRLPLVTLTWSKFRGPGSVAFDKARPEVGADGMATTTATFDAAGDFVLRLQANDASGEGGAGFQCCWTNAHVKVTVAVGSSK